MDEGWSWGWACTECEHVEEMEGVPADHTPRPQHCGFFEMIPVQMGPEETDVIDLDTGTVIETYLSGSAPKEGVCSVCGDTYVGYRVVCEKETCRQDQKTRAVASRFHVETPQRPAFVVKEKA